ncbi:prolyl oligopeptidase family serine peptidase [Mariniflexile jejuense]|uniref:Prolyl oligopeptidase family serine peptidase n=1 Tax=Mariniflexile jejuense TaxID=1173582 RepID=A0ABW3JIJ6_9FLAO
MWCYRLTPLSKWKSAKNWLGTNYNNTSFIESVSPLYHVNNQSPPTFIVHGDADPTVPYQQSVVLYEKLKANGIKTEFLTITGGVHGKFNEEQNSNLSKRMWDFLNNLGL